MSTPVRGAPDGPLGYAPPRARKAGTTTRAGANAFDSGSGSDQAAPLPELDGTPPRMTAARDDRDMASLRETLSARGAAPSLRDALREKPSSLRDALPSRESASSLRQALSSTESLASKDTSRPLREALPRRDGLASGLRDREAMQPPAPPRSSFALRDQQPRDAALPPQGSPARDLPASRDAAERRPPLPPREGLAARDLPSPAPSLRPREPRNVPSRDASASRPPETRASLEGLAGLREALSSSSLDAVPPSRDGQSPRNGGYKRQFDSNGEPSRSQLNETLGLGIDPAQETEQGVELPPPAGETPWKRKRRSSDVFEGDAALKELRSRLAAAPTDQAPEPPAGPAKTPVYASVARLMGMVGLAAGGALAFLWITSPHGLRSAGQPNGEVALVSLRDEPSKPVQNAAAERSSDSSGAAAADAPWSVAKLTDGEKVTAQPVLPQPRTTTAPPPRSLPATRVTAPPAPPAAVTPAVVAPPPPAAVAPLDRDEVNAMLVRARAFLSSGDVAAARVALRRAAANDDAQAALALGGTYDPVVLKKLGIVSFHADPAKAREWYRKAAALGSADATLRLEQMVQTDQ